MVKQGKRRRKVAVDGPISIYHYQIVYPDGGKGPVYLHKEQAEAFIKMEKQRAMDRYNHFSRTGIDKFVSVVDARAYAKVETEPA
jgi:hypothetical protein